MSVSAKATGRRPKQWRGLRAEAGDRAEQVRGVYHRFSLLVMGVRLSAASNGGESLYLGENAA
jgi:hypothetical protein